MIGRGDFLGAILVATGGLDVWDTESATQETLVRVRLSDGSIQTLPLESYLQGVVPAESPASWPAAALQAQAIVARTFALNRINPLHAFDLQAGESDQQFGGLSAHRATTDAAIAATRGAVLMYNSSRAQVFYSAVCGGHTASAYEIWHGSNAPYLAGVVDDPYCSAAPDYRWKLALPLARFSAFVSDIVLGPLVDLALTDPDQTGRPRAVLMRADTQAPVALPVTELRQRIGNDVLKSPWLKKIALDLSGVPTVFIEGFGRGHGVGMCQWGARGMALAGADVAAILTHYFPGTTIAYV
jgi:stage II sporulation protein D